jgi:hypothetical protein
MINDHPPTHTEYPERVTNGVMTRRDREDLAKLVRRREHVAKTSAGQRSGELLADFEQQLATIYKSSDAAWRTITAEARQAVASADAQLAARCRDLCIPEDLRPRLDLNWYGRGDNASRERRAELRKVATSRIAALEKQAKSEIERQSVELQTQLLAGGLESSEARAFLEAMPTVQALMPPLSATDLESAMPAMSARRGSHFVLDE